MPIKWKTKPGFKPEVVLKKIDSVRTVNAAGGVAFSNFQLEECLPALHSMLDFPPVTNGIDKFGLVWMGLVKVGENLNSATFLAAINQVLNQQLATREFSYRVLTALSIDSRDVPKKIRVLGAEIRILSGNYPSRFKARESLLREHPSIVDPTPETYCKVIVSVTAKSPSQAIHEGLRALDLQRAVWCLMGNSYMQLHFGNPTLEPINVVRLGSQHTLHFNSGEVAKEEIWIEPNFSKAKIFRISKPALVRKNSKWVLRQIAASPYGALIEASLIRFVRAFDGGEPNAAFLRLWGALEALVTPGQADYDKVVRRCSFLFKDGDYHRQILEHLREYRNSSVHAGEESENARILCFQLQVYFGELAWFHLRNARYFQSLEEANSFLDLLPEKGHLKRQMDLLRKSIRFVS